MALQVPAPSSEQAQSPYEPPGPQPTLAFDKFQGVKTATTRPGVPDEACFWMRNFFPLAPRNARTMWDIGAPFWTPPSGTSLLLFDFGNFAGVPVMIAFLDNGAIWQIVTTTGVAAQIAVAGTIQNPSQLSTDISQYGGQYIIIVTQQTDGYFIWDGAVFYRPGDLFTDGETLPTGLGGSTVETAFGRVWIGNGPVIAFSAPGSLTLFDTGDGGGNFSSSDSFLRNRFVRLVQSNGFLYLVADSSINYISGVQTSGSPPVTTFTNQNADPEVGSPWPYSVLTFGRNIVFANSFGVHASYGAAVTKVSDDLDGVYNTVPNFASLVPSAAKAIVFGRKVWMLLLPIIDPVSQEQTTELMMWNTKVWFAATQSVPFSFIQHQEIDSVLTAWGSNAFAVYRLFQQPSSTLEKVLQSRLWDTPVGLQVRKATNRLWGMAQYYQLDDEDIRVSIDNELGSSDIAVEDGPVAATWYNDTGNIAIWYNDASAVVAWVGSGTSIIVFAPTAVAQQGMLLGFTVKTNASDLAMISLSMPPEVVGYRG